MNENYRFACNHFSLDENEFSTIIALTDDVNEPIRFVILQKENRHSQKDKRLGMDKIHIEVESQSRSMHGGITNISISENSILIELSEEAKFVLSISGDIEIFLTNSFPRYEELLVKLKKICEFQGTECTG